MSKRISFLPYLFFIVSGGCGLVYEVAWARYLGLFLGNTTLAHMCVLAAFMGGLALGSVVLGALTDRLRRPLAAYGWLEVVIGLYAVAFPFFINPIQSLTLGAASGMEFGSPGFTSLKLAVSVLVLMLPTFLMGGTFPLLMWHFRPAPSRGEDRSEWLYLANCAGAVAGTLLAGFLFIPGLGLKATLMQVGAANAVLGLLAIAAGYISAPLDVARSAPEAQARRREPNPIASIVYLAIGLSGAAAMVYQLVWIRIFAVALGSSTYSFTLMLAAFISGLALGSAALGVLPWMRRRPVLGFALAEVAIALTVLVGIPLYERLPYIFWKWSSLLRPSMESVWLNDLVKYSLCFAVMLVPTFFFGMTLPLAIKAVARRGDQIGRDSGFVYGANTLGTLVGAVLTGLVFIPLIGLQASMLLALVVNLGAGAVLLWVSDIRRLRIPAVAGSLGLAALALAVPQWSPVSLSVGMFREHGAAPPTWKEFQEGQERFKPLWYREDGDGTTAVMLVMDARGGMPDETLLVNGKPDGSARGDAPTQSLVGHIPVLFRPSAKNALMIGLGTGISAGSALTHPDLRLDCVEISPAVARAAVLFCAFNNNVLENPRMNLIIEDARTLLAVTRKKYDVVISEPSNPWVAGMGNLFSTEYFEAIDRVLNPDGVLLQWFHTYEMSDDLVCTIIRTMRRVFPCAYVFQGATNDFLLLGSRQPLEPDFEAMERRMKTKPVREDLDRIGIDSLTALLGLQVLTPETVERLVGDGPVNTDDHPVLEYEAPRAQYIRQTSALLDRADERLRPKADLFAVRYLAGRPLDKDTCRSLVRVYAEPRSVRPLLVRAMLEYYHSKWPSDAWGLVEYARLTENVDETASLAAARAAAGLDPDWKNIQLLADREFSARARRMTALTPQDFAPVLDLLDKALEKQPNDAGLLRKRENVLRLAQ